MLRVFWCECGQKMKAPIESLGKTGKCVSCGRPITVTLENTAPDDAKSRPKPPPGTASQPPEEENPDVRDELLYESERMSAEEADAAASTPVETAEVYSGRGREMAPESERRGPPPKPRSVGPPPPPPRRHAAAEAHDRFSFDSFGHALDLAIDPRKNGFVVLVGLVCSLGLLILMLVGLGLGGAAAKTAESSPGAALGIAALAGVLCTILGILWVMGCVTVAMGGVSRMVAVQMNEGRRATLGEAFNFAASNILGLGFVVVLSWVGLLLVGVIIQAIPRGLMNIPGIGPVLAGLLTIPVFLANLLLICLIFQVVLIPCIMGVENVGATTALARLKNAFAKAGGRILACEILAFPFVLLIVILIVALVSVALAGSMSACVDVDVEGTVQRLGEHMDDIFSWSGVARPDNPWMTDRASEVSVGAMFGLTPQTRRHKEEGAGALVGGRLALLSGVIVQIFLCSFVLVFVTICLVFVYRTSQQKEGSCR